ncbi:hypothetical protein GC197_09060 [bacterium]|nr:hypothetical protein [bacterium]
MANLDQIQQLFEEIGPATNEIEGVFRVDEFEWSVFFSEDCYVDFEFDEAQQKLVLFADLGLPPAECRAKTFEVMLAYNALRKETGGLVISLTGSTDEDELVQSFELNASELNLTTLQNVVLNFNQKAEFWRDVIRQGIVDDVDTSEVATSMPTGAIKV